MEVQITVRHCTITDSLRQRAEERIRRLDKYNPRILAAFVTFDDDGAERRVEVKLDVPGSPPVVSRATGRSFKPALDEAAQRAGRQLKRHRERRLAQSQKAAPKVSEPVTRAPLEG